MTRGYKIVFISFLVTLAIIAALTFAALAAIMARTITPTIEYTLIDAPTNPVCAGEVITLTAHISTSREHSIVLIYESWYSPHLHYNVVLGDHVLNSIIDEPENFARPVTVTVPNLSPGEYEYRRAAQDDGAPIAILRVPVTVKECR